MSLTSNRRDFLLQSASAGAALALGAQAVQAQAMLDEKSPQASTLGYVADAKRADAKKFPKYAAGQACHNCSLFQGKAADKPGGCTLFPGKQVAPGGWCSAWTKKA